MSKDGTEACSRRSVSCEAVERSGGWKGDGLRGIPTNPVCSLVKTRGSPERTERPLSKTDWGDFNSIDVQEMP